METLQAERLLDSNKDDSVFAPATGPIRYMASAFRRLIAPSASPLSSQVPSEQIPERFELMLQCGF
jgi:hypothetical protein